MENVLLKLRLVFWPFVRLLLLTAAGYAAVWAALVWLLGATLGVQLRAESGFLFFFLPLVSSMVVLRWLRPRLHLLEAGGKDIWRSLFYCITIIGIAVAAGAAASVAQEALLQLVSLRDASEVPRYPANTAFVLQQAYVARYRTEYKEVSGSGKGGPYLIIYAATPIFRAAADTVTGQALAWLGARFRSSGDPATAGGEDFDGFLRFRKSVAAAVRAPGLERFSYLVRAKPSDDLLEAVRRSRWGKTGASPLVLEARFGPFATRTSAPLRTLRQAVEWSLGLFLGLLLLTRLHPGQLQEYRRTGRFRTSDALWQELSPLWPRPGFYATPFLVGLPILVFLAMLAAGLGPQPDAADLVPWGASYGPAGHWWRLVASPLLPDGLLHLLNAAWALGWIGWHLEPMVGKRWLVGVYATAALAAGLSSWGLQPGALAVGAAGGILGLYGFGVVLRRRAGPPPGQGVEILVTVGITFAVVEAIIGFATDHINWAMLVGGTVAGLLLGMSLKARIGRNL